jgi:hypothetical protein
MEYIHLNYGKMNQELGKWIILCGIILILGGGVYYLWGDKLSFIGRLPGDIRVEKENFRFYFPITTMILLSILINLVLRLVRFIQGV